MKKQGPAPCGTNQVGIRGEMIPVPEDAFSFMSVGSPVVMAYSLIASIAMSMRTSSPT